MSKHSLLVTLYCIAASFSSLMAQAIEIADVQNTSKDKVFRLGDRFLIVNNDKILSWDKASQQTTTYNLTIQYYGSLNYTVPFVKGDSLYYTQIFSNGRQELWATNAGLTSHRRVTTFGVKEWVLYDNGQAFLLKDSLGGRISSLDLSTGNASYIGRFNYYLPKSIQVECRNNLWLFSSGLNKSGNIYERLYTYSTTSNQLDSIGINLRVADNHLSLRSDSLYFMEGTSLYLFSNGTKQQIASNLLPSSYFHGITRVPNFMVLGSSIFMVANNTLLEVHKPSTTWATRELQRNIQLPTNLQRNSKEEMSMAPFWTSNDTLFLYGFEKTGSYSSVKPVVWFSKLGSGGAQKLNDLRMPALPGYDKNSWLSLTLSTYYFMNGKCCFFSESPTGYDLFSINHYAGTIDRITMPDNSDSPFNQLLGFMTISKMYSNKIVNNTLYTCLRSLEEGNGIWMNDGTGFRKMDDAYAGAMPLYQRDLAYIDSNAMIVYDYKEDYPSRYDRGIKIKFLSLGARNTPAKPVRRQLKQGEWFASLKDTPASFKIGYQTLNCLPDGNTLVSYKTEFPRAWTLSFVNDHLAPTLNYKDAIHRILVVRDSLGKVKWFKLSGSDDGSNFPEDFVTDKNGNVYMYEASTNGRFWEVGDSIIQTNANARLIKINPDGLILWTASLNEKPTQLLLNEEGHIETYTFWKEAAAYDAHSGEKLWTISQSDINRVYENRTSYPFTQGVAMNDHGLGKFKTLRKPLALSNRPNLGNIYKIAANTKGSIAVLTDIPKEELATLGCIQIGQRFNVSDFSIVLLDNDLNPKYNLEIIGFENYISSSVRSPLISFDIAPNDDIIIAIKSQQNSFTPAIGYENFPYATSRDSLTIYKYRKGHLVAKRALQMDIMKLDINATPDGGFILTGMSAAIDSFRITANGAIQHFTTKLFFDQNFPLPPTVKDEAIAQDDLTILPVPTDNYLYVRSDDDDLQDATFECFDVQGRQVALPQGNFMYKEWSVDVSSIPSGMYFLRVKSGRDSHALKFIKN